MKTYGSWKPLQSIWFVLFFVSLYYSGSLVYQFYLTEANTLSTRVDTMHTSLIVSGIFTVLSFVGYGETNEVKDLALAKKFFYGMLYLGFSEICLALMFFMHAIHKDRMALVLLIATLILSIITVVIFLRAYDELKTTFGE